MFSKAKLVITILALTAAGCAGDSIGAASAGGTLAVDAGPVQTLSGASVTSRPERAPITGRDWNCPRCYK